MKYLGKKVQPVTVRRTTTNLTSVCQFIHVVMVITVLLVISRMTTLSVSIFTDRIRSMGEGYVFTGMCHSVHRVVCLPQEADPAPQDQESNPPPPPGPGGRPPPPRTRRKTPKDQEEDSPGPRGRPRRTRKHSP